ncbi:MAG: arylsulfotransferase family protein [Polyangia bacterium]
MIARAARRSSPVLVALLALACGDAGETREIATVAAGEPPAAENDQEKSDDAGTATRRPPRPRPPAVKKLDGKSRRVASRRHSRPRRGRWRRLRSQYRRSTLDAEQQRQIEQLEAIGYMQGSREAPSRSGVTIHEKAAAFSGLNLYVSGHAAEALLIDMRGNVLHRWARGFREVWPDAEVPGNVRNTRFWRWAEPLPDGGLIVIWEGQGIARLDAESNVIWAALNRAHHEAELAPSGAIYTLTRKAHVVPRVNEKSPILEDFLVVLGPGGNELHRVSLLEAFERAPEEYRRIWEESERRAGDIFHTNAVELLDGRLANRIPAFAEGNVMISSRFLDAIAVLDPEREKIVWAARGEFARQHDPTILKNGRLLLFDNAGPKGRYSAVREYDPASMRQIWKYRGSKQRPFFSATCGTAQRLPNGNTLITESDAGRVLEVTRGGKIVWEFINPHRAGEDGRYVATLFAMLRLPRSYFDRWSKSAR